jgi:hypothetical protein
MFRERIVVRIGSSLFLLDENANGICRLNDINRENGRTLTVISFAPDSSFALCMAWELYTCEEDETLLSTAIPGFVSYGVYASYPNAVRDAATLELDSHRIRDRTVVVPEQHPFLLDVSHPKPVTVCRPRRHRF